MGYGQIAGALVRGMDDAQQIRERTADREQQNLDRASARNTRALHDRQIQGQLDDADLARTREREYGSMPEIQNQALDPVGYLEAKAKKAAAIGDTKTYEAVQEKLLNVKKADYTQKFERAMGAFAATKGANYQHLVEVYNKHFPDGQQVEMARNDDGSFHVKLSNGQTATFKDWEEAGQAAVALLNPKSWMDMMKEKEKQKLIGEREEGRDTRNYNRMWDIENLRQQGQLDRDERRPPRGSGSGGAGGPGGGGVTQWKYNAWLAAHPGDTQGALDYAGGRKTMTDVDIRKAAESLAAREKTSAGLPLPAAARSRLADEYYNRIKNAGKSFPDGGNADGEWQAGSARPLPKANGKVDASKLVDGAVYDTPRGRAKYDAKTKQFTAQ